MSEKGKMGFFKLKPKFSPKHPGEQLCAMAAQDGGSLQVQALLEHFHATGKLTEALTYTNKDGRHALMLAAAYNIEDTLKTLLEWRSDVNYMNPRHDANGGTALHEATRNRNEAMADPLLSYGANPFLCNAVGRTCMDEAMRVGSSYLLRKFEQLAIWQGNADIKVSKLGGLQKAFEAHRLVVFPFVPFADQLASKVPPTPKMQLWIYKAGLLMLPVARVSLVGARLDKTSNNEAELSLDPSHGSFDHGNLAVRTQDGCATFRLRVPGDKLAAEATLGALQAVLGQAPMHSTVQGTAYGTAQAPQPWQTPPVHPPPPLDIAYAADPKMQAYLATPGMPNHLPNGTCNMYGPPQTPEYPHGMASPGGDYPYPSAPPGFYPAVPRHLSMDSGSAAAGPSSGPHSAPGFHPPLNDAHSAQAISPPLPTPVPWPAQSAPGFDPVTSGASSSYTPPAQHKTALRDDDAGSMVHAGAIPWSAAVPVSQLQAAGAISDAETAEERLCVICLSAPREAGYLHGATVHMCVCRNCSGQVAQHAPCPLCRQPVERLLTVF